VPARPDASLDGVVTALERAGCVAAREEAAELWVAAGGDEGTLERLVARRTAGEPLAWVTGRTVFCGLVLRVDPGVYVPRPQTEPLAERAADRLRRAGTDVLGAPGARPGFGGRAVDLCTGAGTIAAVLKARVPGAEVIATDSSPAAVECALANGVDARLGHLDEPVPPSWEQTVDVVTAVVPYVPTEALHLLDRDSRQFEPRAALDGGPGGRRWLEEVVRRAPRWLRPGRGALLLELGGDQHRVIRGALAEAGFGPVEVLLDEEGDPRGIEAVLTA